MLTKEQAFPLPLIGEFVGKGQWKLVEHFIYDNPPVKVIIPVGFVTDGASIPRIMFIRRLIGDPWSGKYACSAVVHDYGYHSQTMTRKQVDRIFLGCEYFHEIFCQWQSDEKQFDVVGSAKCDYVVHSPIG